MFSQLTKTKYPVEKIYKKEHRDEWSFKGIKPYKGIKTHSVIIADITDYTVFNYS